MGLAGASNEAALALGEGRRVADLGQEAASGQRAEEAAAAAPPLANRSADARRYLGIDIGAETIKVVELVQEQGRLHWRRRKLVEHGKEPGRVLLQMLGEFGWESVSGRR